MKSRFIVAAIVAMGLSLIAIGNASAGWGCYGVSTGCYGVATGCYGAASSCYGCWGTEVADCSGCYGVGVGPLRRLATRIHAYRAAYSCYGNACYGASSYVSSCDCSESTADAPVHEEASSPPTVTDNTVAAPAESTPVPTEAAPAEQEAAPSSAADNSVAPTTDTPASPEGAPAAADGAATGRPMMFHVDYLGRTPAQNGAKTTLTLHVPEDARVVLAGKETRNVGTTRVYSTAQLARNETWEDYEIQVTLHRDGREVTQRKIVSLHGGHSLELRFKDGVALIAAN